MTQPCHQLGFRRWKSWQVFLTLLALPTSQGRAASDKTAQARGQQVDRSSSSLYPWTGASKWGVGIRLERIRLNVTVRDGRVIKLVLKGPLQVPRALVWVQKWNAASRAQRSGPASPETGTAPTVSRELGWQQPASQPCHKTGHCSFARHRRGGLCDVATVEGSARAAELGGGGESLGKQQPVL